MSASSPSSLTASTLSIVKPSIPEIFSTTLLPICSRRSSSDFEARSFVGTKVTVSSTITKILLPTTPAGLSSSLAFDTIFSRFSGLAPTYMFPSGPKTSPDLKVSTCAPADKVTVTPIKIAIIILVISTPIYDIRYIRKQRSLN